MPIQNVAAILEEILSEADAFIRRRLDEGNLKGFRTSSSPSHRTGRVVLRSNASPDVVRSLGEDLKNVADEN